jgi:hypothetical protein
MKDDQIKFCDNLTNGLVVEMSPHRQQPYDLVKSLFLSLKRTEYVKFTYYFLFVSGRRCSRYQFECHSSGECIAIYNACDGIPQCADGSDEAVELDCPDLGNGRAQNVCQFSKFTAWTIRGLSPGREKVFFLPQNVQTSCGIHKALYSICTWVLSRQVERPVCEVDHLPLSSAEVRNE